MSVDAAALKARYPAFAEVADTTVAAVLADAALDIGEGWIPTHVEAATLALAAHRLVEEGALANADIVAEAGASHGALVQMRAGDTELRFAKPSDGEVIEASGYVRTSYGRRFLELRARSFPAVLVI